MGSTPRLSDKALDKEKLTFELVLVLTPQKVIRVRIYSNASNIQLVVCVSCAYIAFNSARGGLGLWLRVRLL